MKSSPKTFTFSKNTRKKHQDFDVGSNWEFVGEKNRLEIVEPYINLDQTIAMNRKAYILMCFSFDFLVVSNSEKKFSLADGFSLDSEEGRRILKAKSQHVGEVRQVRMFLLHKLHSKLELIESH
jgi:hypothetical protein